MRLKNYIPVISFLISLALTTSMNASAQQQYERDHPAIPYSAGPTANPVTSLLEQIEAGEVTLDYHPVRGYLDAFLETLDIDPSSQVLVFSKTSLKQRFITPHNPRALYFNDDVYVGWVPGSTSLEVGAMDDSLGPVFFDFSQRDPEAVTAEFQLNRCLRCHDTFSMSGGGVPRFMLSSVLAGEEGQIVSHEINFLTDTATPLFDRWGGIYVSGYHGEQRHLGNLVIRDASFVQDREENRNGNREHLGDMADLSRYLRNTSDIVALLVMEHQIEVQNLMTQAVWTVKGASADGSIDQAQLESVARPLVEALLMVNEAPIQDEIVSTSGYDAYFEALGPFDSEGRSLRELDLETRTFRFPVSYLIYSDAFLALPDEVKEYVYTSIASAISGERMPDGFVLNAEDREVLVSLLSQTHAELATYLN